MRLIGWVTAAVLLIAVAPAWALDNICPYSGQNQEKIAQILRMDYNQVPELASHYCANVGLKAYNALGPDSVRDTYLGPIQAVAWVTSGEVVSPPGEPIQMARISGFVYVIGAGGVSDHEFVRWTSDIVGR